MGSVSNEDQLHLKVVFLDINIAIFRFIRCWHIIAQNGCTYFTSFLNFTPSNVPTSFPTLDIVTIFNFCQSKAHKRAICGWLLQFGFITLLVRLRTPLYVLSFMNCPDALFPFSYCLPISWFWLSSGTYLNI